jgi:quinol monooxygenase YgiN
MLKRSSFMTAAAALLVMVAGIGVIPIRSAWAAKPATYDLVYLEVSPQAVGKTILLLRQEAKSALQGRGNLGFLVLQRHPYTNQFVLVGQWTDNASFLAYQQAPSTKQFRAALSPLMIAPYDERPNIDFLSNPARAQAVMSVAPANTLFVLTHIDIAPEVKPKGVHAITALFEQSQVLPGNYVFNVLNQSSHSNHFTLFEAWANQADFTAYKEQGFVRRFRESLMPIMGSIYEERIYQEIN